MKNNSNYKQTEIGLIPEEWDVKTLGECLIKNPDYGINAAAVDYDDTLPTYLRITDISETGKYLQINKASINNTSADLYYLETGDIVFARTGASVGKTYLYDTNDGEFVFAGFLIRIKSNLNILNPNYFIYFTQTKLYWSWVISNSMRSGQPGLNSNQFKALLIPVPTLAEQSRIAAALSDADALISSLEALIAKKRDIKQGAMQTLLQPKDGWEVKRFNDIFVKYPAKSYQLNSDEYEDFGIYPIIDQGKKMIVGYSDKHIKVFNCPTGGVIIFGDHTRIFKFVDYNFIVGADGTQLIAASNNHDTRFLFYLFLTKEIPNTGYNRHFKFLLDMEFFIPNSLAEQQRIAAILSAMDGELSALEGKLEKYQALKLGMMQNLLTGKIRLPFANAIS